jgi:hypothetical protein
MGDRDYLERKNFKPKTVKTYLRGQEEDMDRYRRSEPGI